MGPQSFETHPGHEPVVPGASRSSKYEREKPLVKNENPYSVTDGRSSSRERGKKREEKCESVDMHVKALLEAAH